MMHSAAVRLRMVSVACLCVVLCSSASALAAPASPGSYAATEAMCRNSLKHYTCSEALGRWLPYVAADAVRDSSRTPTHVVDGFRKTPQTSEWAFSAYAPVGTSFAHGSAGPPRGSVVYDRAHRIAFFGEGCCSYFSVVVAASVAPPPVHVQARDLAQIETDSGLHLRDSPANVVRVYGAAPLQPVPGHPEMRMLLYENASPPQPMCTQREEFLFMRGRLSFIGIYDGC